jgi:hypothetical protein
VIRSVCVLLVALTVFVAEQAHALAKSKKPGRGPGPAPAARTVQKRVPPPARVDRGPPVKGGESPTAVSEETASPPTENAATTTIRPAKTKVYTFGAMDVEGKLKTPQLLFFLGRIKLELEMSAPDHRSFMKELEKTADDPNL